MQPLFGSCLQAKTVVEQGRADLQGAVRLGTASY